MSYSDGSKSDLFKTNTEMNENCLTISGEVLARTKFVQAFGKMPRDTPGYITRVLLQDSKNGTLLDWKPDFILSGIDKHTPGPRLEISTSEEVIGIYGSKQD